MAQFYIYMSPGNILLLADYKERQILDDMGFALLCDGYQERGMPVICAPMITAKKYLSNENLGKMYRINDNADTLLKMYHQKKEDKRVQATEKQKAQGLIRSKLRREKVKNNKFYIEESMAMLNDNLFEFLRCCKQHDRSVRHSYIDNIWWQMRPKSKEGQLLEGDAGCFDVYVHGPKDCDIYLMVKRSSLYTKECSISINFNKVIEELSGVLKYEYGIIKNKSNMEIIKLLKDNKTDFSGPLIEKMCMHYRRKTIKRYTQKVI